jgi:hypothetical protein
MHDRPFLFLSRGWSSILALFILATFLRSTAGPVWAIDSLRGGALSQALPLFPPKFVELGHQQLAGGPESGAFRKRYRSAERKFGRRKNHATTSASFGGLTKSVTLRMAGI